MGRFSLALTLLALSGCASVPMTSLEDDSRAKSFAVAPDKSSIYVYRNETLGAAVYLAVTLDGRMAGQTAAKTYFLFEVAPGEHEITSIGENVSALRLRTDPGKAYFVWQEVKMGMWSARSLLQQVDDATGRAGVAESGRIASTLPTELVSTPRALYAPAAPLDRAVAPAYVPPPPSRAPAARAAPAAPPATRNPIECDGSICDFRR